MYENLSKSTTELCYMLCSVTLKITVEYIYRFIRALKTVKNKISAVLNIY